MEQISTQDVQYVSDADGNPVSVIVPLELWQTLLAENETDYLLQSNTMKKRLLESLNREDGIPFEVVREELGILPN